MANKNGTKQRASCKGILRGEHAGPFRPVVGALYGSETSGEAVVVCMSCGAFQRPLAPNYPMQGSVDPCLHPWSGTKPDLTLLPEGATLRPLDEPTFDLRQAHAVARFD